MERCFVGKIDWLSALDLKQAVENIKNEIPGDWYQDPWGLARARLHAAEAAGIHSREP